MEDSENAGGGEEEDVGEVDVAADEADKRVDVWGMRVVESGRADEATARAPGEGDLALVDKEEGTVKDKAGGEDDDDEEEAVDEIESGAGEKESFPSAPS